MTDLDEVIQWHKDRLLERRPIQEPYITYVVEKTIKYLEELKELKGE